MMEVGGERQAGDMGQGGPWRCQSRGEPVSGPWSCVPPGKVPGGLGQKRADSLGRRDPGSPPGDAAEPPACPHSLQSPPHRGPRAEPS